jgi:two-component system, cell cycle response regulator DivK
MSALILLVEDNEQNSYLAKFLLEHAGHRVRQAPNGDDALRFASEEKPDLVLMDIQLPAMDGYEAALRLRELPGLDRLPIVAITSYAMPGDRERAILVGFIGYIEKPISAETFVNQVAKFLPPSPP